MQRTASWRQARNLRAYPNPDTMEILWNSPKQEEEGPQLGTILPSEAKLSEKDDRGISHNEPERSGWYAHRRWYAFCFEYTLKP